MLLEILIVLEVVAFLFLALGIIPFKKSDEAGNLPLLNKIIFVIIAGLLFMVLAATSVNYSYTHCYINETSVDASNTTTQQASCMDHMIEDQGLSYLNWGLGIVSMLLAFVMIIITAFSRHDRHYTDE